MINDGEITRRRIITMGFHAFVDGREVVKHLVRPIYFFFDEAEECRDAISVYPKRRDPIVRLLRNDSRTEPVSDFLRDGRDVDHTWSGSLSTAAFCRDGRIRSRMDGRGARIVSWEPTTQVSEHSSIPKTFCHTLNPALPAGGHRGQPRTQTSAHPHLPTPPTPP